MANVFDTFLVYPIINTLVAVYQVLNLVHIPYALGFSIIILTILIRFVLYPLTAAQLKSSKKMQDVAPHLSKLKEKHKGDAKRLQAETMRLYKEHGVNPVAGCLPVIIQLPIIWALYSVLQKVVSFNSHTIVTEVNKIVYPINFLKLTAPWDPTFFGIPLGKNPGQLINIMPLIILVPLLTALFQFLQSKMLFSPKKELEENKKKDKKEKNEKEDFATAFQTQSTYIFPLMIGFFSYSFPIGLSLYWNTFTLFGILQQYKISGLGGLAQWKEKIIGIKK
ncbi:MAG: YidC/Oxa1 family membrane protein insertase [Candidatus Levybacteria bacterium]|nr:YidC/Oxa1 family membrane protein insertase [Candidatus Levybacteria bacterium]